ncbi:unnamed protein product [Penicillium pancosmium]
MIPTQGAAEPTADPCQRLSNDDLLYGANEEAVGSLPVEWYWDVGLTRIHASTRSQNSIVQG